MNVQYRRVALAIQVHLIIHANNQTCRISCRRLSTRLFRRLFLLDPERGSQKATPVVLLVAISSIKIAAKALLIRSG